MRVALVTYALQVGGIETFLRLLGRYLIDRGHDVTFIESWAKGQWSECFSTGGYKVIQILGNPLGSRLRHARRIADQLKNYDVVILNDAPFAQASLGLLTEQTIAIPVVHTSLTSMIRNAAGSMFRPPMLRECKPHARRKPSGLDPD